MFGLFGWLRNAVKAAILGGVNDAVNELSTADVEDAAPVTLRLTFTPEKPDAPAKKRKDA